ncbi:hypothetical protein H0H92_001545 [Tricholoma furcatifolium]|nr:hypothetical protein H0H92_001545 [Tricholoma furcatifolium]
MSSDQDKIPVKGDEAKSGEVAPESIGEDFRGSVLGVFDLSHEDQAVNEDIAHKGRAEADQSMARLKKMYATGASGGSQPGASSGQTGTQGTAGETASGRSVGPQEVQAKSGAPSTSDAGSANIGERGI